MNHSTSRIIRSLFSLLIMGIIAVAAASEARAQCGATTVTFNNVFVVRPASPSVVGTLTLDFGGGVTYSQTFAASADGSTTIAYNPALGFPTNVTLDINGTTIVAPGTAVIPDPYLPLSFLCLQATLTVDPSGCIIVVVEPVCC